MVNTVPIVLVLIPTYSQTIEQRVCLGIHEGFAHQDVRILHLPMGYLPESLEELDQESWIHIQLKSLRPDIILAYGGGLSYKSGPTIFRNLLNYYHPVPVINIGNVIDLWPSIEVDNYQGMLSLMRAILKRRADASILYLSGPPKNEDNRLRMAALQAALEEQGRSLSECKILEGDYTSHVADHLFSQYLNETESLVNLVVCANDLSAKGVLDSLKRHQIRCPEDIWVTGFDDFEYAASMQPGLTTVHFPARNMGIAAAERAIQYLNGQNKDIDVLTVPSYPVFRGSTADEHPGIGEFEKQLREQWALVQQRDNNARKLNVLRIVQKQMKVQDVLEQSKLSLADLDVHHVSLFTSQVNEDGASRYQEYNFDGQILRGDGEGFPLPDEFYLPHGENYWLLCALDIEEHHYGYLVANCSPVSAEFVEFIAPQFTEILHTEALIERNEHYREQNELNERMSSLGALVSGIAHEINTPVGTGKLAASSLIDSLTSVQKKVAGNSLRKQDFEQFLLECDEFSRLIYQSFERAAGLISNFKMISVDQTAEEIRSFDLGNYVGTVMASLQYRLKGTRVQLTISLDDDIQVQTYPSSIAQVLTNLFTNALHHGFDNGESVGEIDVSLRKKKQGFALVFSDNGHGASKDVVRHLFDPFFTSDRGEAGSGLGMHIVFNLVTQKLNWTVKVESEVGQGLAVILHGS